MSRTPDRWRGLGDPCRSGVASHTMKTPKRMFVTLLLAGITSLVAQAVPREPWLSVTAQPANTLHGVTFGDGLFVAVGDLGTILTSTDGANWTAPATATSQVDLYAVTVGVHGFVAVGATRDSFSQPVVWTSPDGYVWTPRDVSALNLTWGNNLLGVTCGDGVYVAVGGNAATNTVQTSTNGIEWTMRDSHLSNSGLIPLGGVAYGNGVFVAGGPWLITSPDGIAWTKQDSSAWYRLYAMTFADGRFVGVGPYSRICSTNGTNWSVGTPSTGDYINGVAYGDGFYVCLGYKPAYSANGTNWIVQTNNAPGNAIAYGNSVFVAVGSDGQIYRTASTMHASVQKDTAARLTLAALVPGTCRIDSSTNLTDSNGWTTLATLFLTTSPTNWTDWGSTNVPIRFYRAVWTP